MSLQISDILLMIGETLLMTIISVILAYLIGLPLGILLHITGKNGLKPNKWINGILGTFTNILRSIPCLILVVICMPLTRMCFDIGTGEWFTIIIPLVITSFGFIARLVEQSLNEVPVGEIEAVKSLGATDFQVIMKVLLPEAKPSLISSIAVSSVSILGFTSFAYNIAAGGLIAGIWTYYTRHTGDYLIKFEFWLLILIVIIIVQGFQELGLWLSKKLDKRRTKE